VVGEVNKIIGNALAARHPVTIPGVGTLVVIHRGAHRVARNRIAAPRDIVDFASTADGVSLVALIAAAGRCDEALARDIFERWLEKCRNDQVLTIAGVGTLRQKSFIVDPLFDRRMNPHGDEIVKLPVRMNAGIVMTALCAALVGIGVVCYLRYVEPVFEKPSQDPVLAERMRRHEERKSVSARDRADQTAAEAASGDAIAAPAAASGSAAPAAAPGGNGPSSGMSDGRHSAAPQASDGARPTRLQRGWHYVVLGVFSTPENAERCRKGVLEREPSLMAEVYPFGAKYMVSLFAAEDEALCRTFMEVHRKDKPDLWIYTKR